MKSALFLAPALLLASASIAFSADAVSQIPEAPAAQDTKAFSWDGIYLGGLVGYGRTNLDGDLSAALLVDNFNGARIGAFVGYNWSLQNNIVLGVEGDVNYDFNKKDLVQLSTPYSVETNLSGSLRGRVGYAMGNALFYGAAGVTATKLKVDILGTDFKDTTTGWTVGAGVDYAFTDKIFGRVEYRYNDYGTADLNGFKGKLDQHVVNVGVGVKF